MPVYGIPQAGDLIPLGLNLTALIPGEQMTLFDGTETAALNLTSVAFARGYSPSADDAGTTFRASVIPTGMIIDVQSANHDIEAEYSTVGTMIQSDPSYTDTGRSAFYRLKVSAYTSGAMPVCTAQR